MSGRIEFTTLTEMALFLSMYTGTTIFTGRFDRNIEKWVIEFEGKE